MSPHPVCVAQGLLVALETPHSPKGLHLLARHSHSFASAVLLSITTLTSHSTSPNGSLQAASVTETKANSLRAAAKQQATVQKPEQQSWTNSLKAMRHLQQGNMRQQHATCRGPAPDTSCVPVSRGSILHDPPAPHSHKATAAAGVQEAGVAAAVATAHRCLESMLARDNIFALPPAQIAQMLFSPALFFTAANCTNPTPTAAPASSHPTHHIAVAAGQGNASAEGGSAQGGVGVEGLQWGLREGAGVYMGCCSLVMAGLRHHAGVIRRCMALVGASTRALLKALMLWSQQEPSTMR